ncbi:MAG: PAS domain S-box protein [Rivularia sp. ALOHA_DT_140]|nr:PAS domain S-box protein [Rivularia sp. ALOHA_DT_140]
MQTAFPDFSLPPLERLIDYTSITVETEATIWDAIALMNRYGPRIKRILVVENRQVVGFFSSEDVLKFIKPEVDLKSSKITEAMKTSVFKVKYSQLQDKQLILKILLEFKKPVFIQDNKNQYVGYIAPETITSLLVDDYRLRINKSEEVVNKNPEIIYLNKSLKNENVETLLYFRQAIEGYSQAILITDANGDILCVNSSFTKIYKYNIQELGELEGLSFILNDKAEYKKLLSTIEQGITWHNLLEIKKDNGEDLSIHIRTDGIKDMMGKLIGMITTHTDITQKTKAQKKLELKYQGINIANNGVVVLDARLVSKPVIYANDTFQNICNQSVSQGQKNKYNLIENINHEINKLEKIYHNAPLNNCNIIVRNYCKNSRELWYQFSVSPIINDDNKVSHYICIQTDITKYKQTEMSLLVTQGKLQHLLSSSTGVIYSSEVAEDYGINFISDNIVDMTGYETENILCDTNFWISYIHPEDVELFVTKKSQLLTQTKVNIEYRFLHKNGHYIWIYEQSTLAKDNAGNHLEIIAYCIDISERKKLEEELQQSLKKEKELNELKSGFISMTSHEFRTPLSTILSSSELLENYRHKWDEQKQLKHLNRIQNSVNHMNNLLNDVLFFGKAEAGKIDCKPVNLDLIE